MPKSTLVMLHPSDDWFHAKKDQRKSKFDGISEVMVLEKNRQDYWRNKWLQVGDS